MALIRVIIVFSGARLRPNDIPLVWFRLQNYINCLINAASVLLAMKRLRILFIHSRNCLNVHTTHVFCHSTLSWLRHYSCRSYIITLLYHKIIIIVFYNCNTFLTASHEPLRNFIICSCASVCLFIVFLTASHRIAILLVLVFLGDSSCICNARSLLSCMIHLYLIGATKKASWYLHIGTNTLAANSTP